MGRGSGQWESGEAGPRGRLRRSLRPAPVRAGSRPVGESFGSLSASYFCAVGNTAVRKDLGCCESSPQLKTELRGWKEARPRFFLYRACRKFRYRDIWLQGRDLASVTGRARQRCSQEPWSKLQALLCSRQVSEIRVDFKARESQALFEK